MTPYLKRNSKRDGYSRIFREMIIFKWTWDKIRGFLHAPRASASVYVILSHAQNRWIKRSNWSDIVKKSVIHPIKKPHKRRLFKNIYKCDMIIKKSI